ncbi:addiction module protein [Desulfobacterales bacterium HSG2]|nr:addiction module protein [Desulfobacterales bacterium HSG2]
MPLTESQLYDEAILLPDSSKIFLVEKLLENIGENIDHDVGALQIREAKRRSDEIRSGQVLPVSGEDDNMIREIHKQIFSSLLISREVFMDEMAILLAKQQLSDYSMETDYFEKKYGMNFQEFDRRFRSQEASYERENDWMDWKFAVESRNHWQNILKQAGV